MPRRAILILAALVLLVGAAACERTAAVAPPAATLQFTTIDFQQSIPAEYGRLVAVTTSGAYPGWAQLWFEKPDSSVVALFVNFQEGTVRNKMLELPRS